MDYMMDKINLHSNKDEIVNMANKVVKMIKEDKKLDDSEKIMTMELANALLNKNLYKSSKKKENK